LRVEFIGLPGVGKSTLRRDILGQLNRIDRKRYLSAGEAFLQVSKLDIDNIFRAPLRYLPQSLALKFSQKLTNRSLMQFDAQNRFLAARGKALSAFLISNAYRNMSLQDRKIVIGSFLEIGSMWECINGRLIDDPVIIFDEGFVQKSFMFVDHTNDSAVETAPLYAYLENIPLPDMIIYITADLGTCQKRMMTRSKGLTERLKKADKQKVANFLTISNNHLNSVTEWLNKNCGERLIEINNELDFEDGSVEVIEKIQNIIARI